MKKRLISLLLCVLLLCPAVSCSQQTENAASDETATAVSTPSADSPEETEPAPEEPEIVEDNLPDRDYGGFAFNIYTRSNTTHYAFLTEELNGEVLNDAIYERNLKVADRFNVTFTETEYSDEVMAQNNVQSGDDTFSLMNVRCTAADTMAKKGM